MYTHLVVPLSGWYIAHTFRSTNKVFLTDGPLIEIYPWTLCFFYSDVSLLEHRGVVLKPSIIFDKWFVNWHSSY